MWYTLKDFHLDVDPKPYQETRGLNFISHIVIWFAIEHDTIPFFQNQPNPPTWYSWYVHEDMEKYLNILQMW
jgi:hypothetical protein